MPQWMADVFVPPRYSKPPPSATCTVPFIFFVEVDVAHVAVDAGIAADAQLADAAGTVIGVERLEQEVFFDRGGGIDDPAFREAKTNAPQLPTAPLRRKLGKGDRSLRRRLHGAEEELSARHVPSARVDVRSSPGHGQPQVGAFAHDPYLLGLAEEVGVV